MPGLTRRQFLTAGRALGLTTALSACGTPLATSLTGAQPATADVIFWHLFGGGDGENMATMVDEFRSTTGLSVEATLLSWGNPYYTKLALAASSGRPPDVGISHLSRLPLLARAGLLEPLEDQVDSVGIAKDKFTPAAWDKATVDGRLYAVPLDTHPFVLFYNVDLAEKAGLLNAAGDGLKPMSGSGDFVDAIKAMKDAGGGDYGAVVTVTADPSTCWRLFLMTYSGLAGPLVTDLGTKVAVDRTAMEDTFAFLQGLSTKGLIPGNATAVTSSSLFSQGEVGFLFDGEWQIPTYRDIEGLKFNVVPFPALLGPEPVAYADSHSFVIPTSSVRSPQRGRDALRFVRSMLDESMTWAEGGHVPAWLPVQESAAFRKMQPQSGYTRAAFDAVYDPEAWYTGAGSDFQTAMGSVVAGVLNGSTDPRSGVDAMTATLKTFSTAQPPVQ